MKRRKPLRADPEKTREWQQRSRKPLARGRSNPPKSDPPPRRAKAPRQHSQKDTGPSEAVRDEVRRRAGGHCEHCGRVCRNGEIHHRKPRQMGGSSDPRINLAANLLYLRRACHRYIEDHRTEAYAMGWLVRQGDDPAKVPVRVR